MLDIWFKKFNQNIEQIHVWIKCQLGFKDLWRNPLLPLHVARSLTLCDKDAEAHENLQKFEVLHSFDELEQTASYKAAARIAKCKKPSAVVATYKRPTQDM